MKMKKLGLAALFLVIGCIDGTAGTTTVETEEALLPAESLDEIAPAPRAFEKAAKQPPAPTPAPPPVTESHVYANSQSGAVATSFSIATTSAIQIHVDWTGLAPGSTHTVALYLYAPGGSLYQSWNLQAVAGADGKAR